MSVQHTDSSAGIGFNGLAGPNGSGTDKWIPDLEKAICSSLDLKELEIPRRPFLIGEWFQEGDLGFVYAQRGVGKSFFAMDMAHALSERRPFGPWQVYTEAKVLYLDGEMPPDAIKDRDCKLGNPSEKLRVHQSRIALRSGRPRYESSRLVVARGAFAGVHRTENRRADPR